MITRYKPSRITAKSSSKAVELQFMMDHYDLRMLQSDSEIAPPLHLTCNQLNHVALDMRAVDLTPVKLSFQNRCVVIEVAGKVWARVPDVYFIRLQACAGAGQGESLECGSL